MSKPPANTEEAGRMADGLAATSPPEVDPAEASLMVALRASVHPAHDCGKCKNCRCGFDQGAAASAATAETNTEK